MAATDHSLALRGGVIAWLLGDSYIATQCGERVYNEEPPRSTTAWPWIMVRMAEGLPTEASCWIGTEQAFSVDVFAKGPGSDACRRLLKAIVSRLDGAKPTLELESDEPDGTPVPGIVELGELRRNVIADRDEPGAYHGIVDFSATTAEDA